MPARKPPRPFRRFISSPEVIRLVVMMDVRYALSLCKLEDLLAERGIEVSCETVRFWSNRFGPMFAAEIRRKRVDRMCAFTHWRCHLDEVYVRINGVQHYLSRAVDHEGEVLEPLVTKERDKTAAFKFIQKALKRHGSPQAITTDGLRSYGAAMRELGAQPSFTLAAQDPSRDDSALARDRPEITSRNDLDRETRLIQWPQI